jgi:L-lactate dehydrogenase complex protein LldG
MTASPSGAARSEVLARIAAALSPDGPASGVPAGARAGTAPPGAGAAEVPAGGPAAQYRLRGERPAAELMELLASRLVHYRAQVRRASAATLTAVVGEALTDRGARRVLVPAGFGIPLPAGLHTDPGDRLSAAELDGFDAVVTTAAVAIAETGTIILDGSPGQGRRALSLVPDYHLCVVTGGQVVELVPEAVARLPASTARPLTWISGPSATSDIELERVEGVHGPRTLEVILVPD